CHVVLCAFSFSLLMPSAPTPSPFPYTTLFRSPGTVLSVSHTTRAPRPGERAGEHYHFVDHDTFRAMIGRGEFLEYAEVFGNFYRSEEHTSALQSRENLVCRLLLEKKDQRRQIS